MCPLFFYWKLPYFHPAMKKETILSIFHNQFPFLTKEDAEQLFQLGIFKTFKNKESILQSGQKTDVLFYILEGMIRGYFIENSGEEKTMFMKPPLNFIAPPEAIENKGFTKYHFESIDKTAIIEFPFQAFTKLAEENLAFARVNLEALKENVSTLVWRVEMLAGKSPEERYEILLKHRPQFFQKAYHKHIANYLGITPNSLSRIIKRKKEGKS